MALMSEADFRLIQKYLKRVADPHKIEARVSKRVAIEKLPRTRVTVLAILMLLGFGNWLFGNQSDAILGQTASAFMAQKAEAPDQATIKLNTKQAPKVNTKTAASPTAPKPSQSLMALPADTGNSGSGPSTAQQYNTAGYSYGHCTAYVASRRPVPGNWGNARDWLPRAKAMGWLTGPHPTVGAIAWTPSGTWGHVAYVEEVVGDKVRVSEMNYVGWNVRSSRWAAASSFQYIY
ncbi:CHAP domain-containing protein [bacterium]|nr:CHAP domain-containing protein [bacterium]